MYSLSGAIIKYTTHTWVNDSYGQQVQQSLANGLRQADY